MTGPFARRSRPLPRSIAGSVRSTPRRSSFRTSSAAVSSSCPIIVAQLRPDVAAILARLARRRRARVRRRDGVRRTRGAPAARGRRIRLSARCLWTAGRLPDRLDVVRGRLLRGDCRERRGAGRVPGPLRAGRRRRARRCSRIPLPLVTLVVSPRTLVALAAIAVLTVVHVRGLGPGRLVQNASPGVKVAALVAVPRARLRLGPGRFRRTVGTARRRRVGLARLLLALVPVMFTYSGWNAAAYVAEEVAIARAQRAARARLRHARRGRRLPRAERAVRVRAARSRPGRAAGARSSTPSRSACSASRRGDGSSRPSRL